MTITIYHNPGCGTSRNTLEMIRLSDEPFNVVEYLKTGWTLEQLQKLFADAGMTPREALRIQNTPAEAMGLLADDVTDELLLAAMVDQPILVNRPFVVTPLGTALCRPSEKLLDILPNDSNAAAPNKTSSQDDGQP